jgi:hypothetical protein
MLAQSKKKNRFSEILFFFCKEDSPKSRAPKTLTLFLSDISLEESPLHTFSRDGELEEVKEYLSKKKVFESFVTDQQKKKKACIEQE